MSSTISVHVKWANGKETFKDLELDFSEAPSVFKAQIFALTNVLPERQKLMIKGKLIGDEEWTDELRKLIKKGTTLMLMGSAEQLSSEPVLRPQFVEDMSESELASAHQLPTGLVNLNTCYMNATLQCLKTIPELTTALGQYSDKSRRGVDVNVVSGLRDLFKGVDTYKTSVPHIFFFLQLVHTWQPRYAEKGEGGVFVQQDANEFCVLLMSELKKSLKVREEETEHNSTGESSSASSQSASGGNVIDRYFGVEFVNTLRCAEATEESAQVERTSELQLSCFIGPSVTHLYTGLKQRLEETIVKQSPSLERDADYSKTSRISRLPAYLCVQMVRFEFKTKSNVSAKILKDIKFSMMLDVYDLCTDELKARLSPAREQFKVEEDRKAAELSDAKLKGASARELEKSRSAASRLEGAGFHPSSFDDDPGSNNSGYYELQAVLTHQGRTSSSGHYVAWVKREGGSDEWVKCDDDTLSLVTQEEVLKLSGGAGDWHTAYVLFYGSRKLQLGLPQPEPVGEGDKQMAAETMET